MNILTGVGILLLSMLIAAFSQLKHGVFLLFLHYTSGKFKKDKVSILSLFYILGVEIVIAIIFTTIYYMLDSLFAVIPASGQTLFEWIIAGILIGLGFIFPFCYFKKGPGTKLFISRNLASQFSLKAKNIKTRSDAFVLGIVSSLPELILIIPLIMISIISITKLDGTPLSRAAIILAFILLNVVPLFIIQTLFYHHYNLADLERKREKSKNFIRFLISFSYISIAILIIAGGVLN